MHNSMKPFLRRMLPLALSAALLTQPVLAASQPEAPQGWTSLFCDVQEDHWFYPFVASLNANGVINGYTDGRFGPNDSTRAGDSIIMILKAAGSGTLEPSQDTTHYSASYVNYAVTKGWLTQEQGSNDPDGAISRLFIAQLAAKALGLPPSKGTSPFSDVTDGYVTALYRQGIVAGNQEGDKLLFKPDSSITRAEISAIVWRVQEYASHIHFGTYTLDILEGLPVNAYDSRSFTLDGSRMHYTADGVRTALGIDVSSYQGEVNWEKVRADGIDFVMLRVGGRGYTVGSIYDDTRFLENIQGATQAGLDVGVYFFSQATSEAEAREEANYVLDKIHGYQLTYPVVFDWENISSAQARTHGLDSATLTAAANTFCQEVQRAGYQPMVYFNRYIAYLRYDLEGIAQYPFWLAQYSSTPSFYYDFQMWQYSDAGQVDGIQGRVDMNLRIFPQ